MAARPIPFIDGHNDVLLALHLAGEGAGPFLGRRSEGHLDLERAREGAFAAGFFAVFVLPESEEERRGSGRAYGGLRSGIFVAGRCRPNTQRVRQRRSSSCWTSSRPAEKCASRARRPTSTPRWTAAR